jgi:glycosyltransferase involved in cell wall biosynthesis
MKYPITVCLIAKNEEKNIEECLRRLVPYGFEIVVADTGSSDRTVEIAKDYADKIVNYKWNDNFSAARNYCAKHASNDWILALDCDEHVEKINVAALMTCIEEHPYMCGEINIKHIARFDGANFGYINSNSVRLYNRRYYEFKHAVNEKIKLKKMSFNPNPNDSHFIAPVELLHHGFNVTDSEIRLKQERLLGVLYGALKNTTANKHTAYIRFLLGQAYTILGDDTKAIENYTHSLYLSNDMKLDYMPVCLMELGNALERTKRFKESEELVEKYGDILTYEKPTFEHGLAILRSGVSLERIPEAIFSIEDNPNIKFTDNFIRKYKLVIAIFDLFNNHDLAVPYIQKYEQYLKSNRFTDIA